MNKTSSFVPDFWDMVFSIKTFAAAMLALFIAFCFDLSNPYWAMTTVYIVANPLSGASTSKAVYRLIGTAAGGTMSVILVPNLVNAPELLTLGVALWVGLCLAASLLDRSPRSYSFMLAGYTTALTSFPLVDSPENVFTYTTSRVVEICVAIICTALISRIVFPRHAGPVLAARVDAWLNDGSALVGAVLEGRSEDPAMVKLGRKLAVDAADIRLFTTHVAYDTSKHRETVGLSRELQSQMVVLLPIVSGLADVLSAIAKDRHGPHLEVSSLIGSVATWIRSRQGLTEDSRLELLSRISRADIDAHASDEWEQLLVRNLMARLRELVEVWSDCIDLQHGILSGEKRRRAGQALRASRGAVHVDIGMALFSGFSAALAIVIGCAIWIVTGWSSGAGVPLISGILICFFAAQDNPTPVIRKFLIFSLYAMLLSFVFVFAVMPMLGTFTVLVSALAFLFLPLGLLIAKPATFLPGMALCTNIPTMLTLQARPNLDLSSFLNANLATILGTIMTIYIATLVRSVGVEWSARRLLRSGWGDIAAVARKAGQRDFRTLMHRMLDRFALITPRLANIPESSAVLRTDILKDMRVGINVIGLQQQKDRLSPDEAEAVDTVLEGVGNYYKAKQRKTESSPSPNLLATIDRSLETTFDRRGSPSADAVRLAFVGLRYNLFPDATGFGSLEPNMLREAAE